MTKSRRRLKQVERWLEVKFPAPMPVRVRVEKFNGDDRGYCWDRDDHFLLRVRSTLPLAEQIETLLHEWAHTGRGCMDHGEPWAIRFGRIYQNWFDFEGSRDSEDF